MNFKATLIECDILFQIDGITNVKKLETENQMTRLRIYKIIKKFEKKGILKVVRKLDN